MTKADIQDFLEKVLFMLPVTPKKIAIALFIILIVFFAGRVSANETHTPPVVIHDTNHIHSHTNVVPYVIGGAVIGFSLRWAWDAKKDDKVKIGIEARKPE